MKAFMRRKSPPLFHCILSLSLLGFLCAQTTTTAPKPAIAPPFTSAADIYSGISGPGKPVVGEGGGGWRSNQQVLRYDGPGPKPGWEPLGPFACTSSVVKAGLLPPLKPIWDLHLRDTIINRGPDGTFYMTGSSGDNIWDRNDGIELWRSNDLKTWDYLGLVWSFDKDATWQARWGTLHNHQVRAIWAPEVHYLKSKKNFFLTFSLASGSGTGLLESTTGKPEGPYVNPLKPDTRFGGGIDPTLFEDDDGKIYVTSGRGGYIALMKDDMSGIAEQRNVKIDKSDATAADGSKDVPRDLLARTETGMEGASLFKRKGKYYLGAAAFWGGSAKGRYDSVVCIADNVWGPYTHWHEAVPCGGGTNYFQDNAGNWFCCLFGNDEQCSFREKPGIIEIDFDATGRVIVADEQPAWILQNGTPTRWRKAAGTRLSLNRHRETFPQANNLEGQSLRNQSFNRIRLSDVVPRGRTAKDELLMNRHHGPDLVPKGRYARD